MERRRWLPTALISSIAGTGMGLALFAIQAVIAMNASYTSPFKQAILVLNWPPLAFLDWYTKTVKNGHTDQVMMGPWLLVIPLYWSIVGAVVGFGCYKLMRRRIKG